MQLKTRHRQCCHFLFSFAVVKRLFVVFHLSSPICSALALNAVFRLWKAVLSLLCQWGKSSGHSLTPAELESPSGTKMHRVFLFSRSSLTSQIHGYYHQRNKTEVSRKGVPNFSVHIPHWHCGGRVVLSQCGCCEWTDGRVESSITAAAGCSSIRRQTMWGTMCPRMQMSLTVRDGLCVTDHTDATDSESHFLFIRHIGMLIWEQT